LLVDGIEVRGCLVEDQDRRVLQERACDGHALALATGELGAPLADDRVEPVRKAGHQIRE